MNINLQKFGLDESESSVYEALLGLGTASVTEITRTAGITRTLGYHVIEKLLKKGLIDPILTSGKQSYKAKHPRALAFYVKKRQQEWKRKTVEVEDVLGDLVSMYARDDKPVLRYQEGVRGLIELYEEKLLCKTEILSILDVESWKAPEFWEWAQEYHKRRTRKGIHERILLLDTPEGRDWIHNYFGKPRETTYRWISTEQVKSLLQFGGAVDVYDDTVMISLLDQQKKMGIIIENSVLSNIFRALFELAWSTAEPVVFSP